MTTKAEVQDLLRFLTQDAKIPLPMALAKIKDLQQASLTEYELFPLQFRSMTYIYSPANPGNSVTHLSKSNIEALKAIFIDEKLAKQVLNAAKRVSKKRSSDSPSTPPTKRSKKPLAEEPLSPMEIEESLALPVTDADEDVLRNTVIHTNRAPLVLAFAVILLKYTMPNQPLSSRLSLAQSVVSANSRSKAVSIGLAKGISAEEEGWGRGQPVVRVMGREIRVLKRWGYDSNEGPKEASTEEASGVKEDEKELEASASTVKAGDDSTSEQRQDSEPALWGLDLESLRSSNGSTASGSKYGSQNLPIYTPQSARAYLLRSFDSISHKTETAQESSGKKKSAATKNIEKERNLALLLRALDLLYESWASYLKPEELDGRAWSWYVHVRPEVQSGVAGWGGKGEVKIADILKMRRNG
ncbi:MAG: hypothetical protein MMC33_008711 [Icmadophila ericetorum]|nr:hypothetical protein [Icmadophila ericetorum]